MSVICQAGGACDGVSSNAGGAKACISGRETINVLRGEIECSLSATIAPVMLTEPVDTLVLGAMVLRTPHQVGGDVDGKIVDLARMYGLPSSCGRLCLFNFAWYTHAAISLFIANRTCLSHPELAAVYPRPFSASTVVCQWAES